MKKLSEVFTEDCIKLPLTGDSREEVIKELIEVLATKNLFKDKQDIFKAVMERERIMTTGVGNGIAIPHCKHESCVDFRIALGLSKEDIEFQAVDQKPVRIIFLLVGPTNAAGMHIKLLSRITRILSKPELREELIASLSSKDVFRAIMKEEEMLFE